MSFPLARRVLLFVENDDAKQFQKCSKSRNWSPRHLVFVVILQDLDHSTLRCSSPRSGSRRDRSDVRTS